MSLAVTPDNVLYTAVLHAVVFAPMGVVLWITLLLLLLPNLLPLTCQAAAAAPAEQLADEDDELRERLNAMRTT
jgi:hypothetical protein